MLIKFIQAKFYANAIAIYNASKMNTHEFNKLLGFEAGAHSPFHTPTGSATWYVIQFRARTAILAAESRTQRMWACPRQTIDVGTAGLLSKQWTSIRHILSLLVTANACVHVTAYVAVRRSLSTTYTAVVLGLLLRQYVSYQFGVWAGYSVGSCLCK